MDKAIIQYTNSYEVSVVGVVFITVDMLRIIKEWRRMRSIHLIWKSRVNCAAAGCLYTEYYPQRRHPNSRTFISLERCVGETGRMLPNMTKAGRPRSRRGANVKDVCVP
jgi:hypothetical protein